MDGDTPTGPFEAPAGVTWACLSSRKPENHHRTRHLRAPFTHVNDVAQSDEYGVCRLFVMSSATSRTHTATPIRIRAMNIRIHMSSHALRRQNIIEHRASTRVHRYVEAVFRRASVMYAWCHA